MRVARELYALRVALRRHWRARCARYGLSVVAFCVVALLALLVLLVLVLLVLIMLLVLSMLLVLLLIY